MNIKIRKFDRNDIPLKVSWINDVQNNQYLHYDLPLDLEKTERWYVSHIGDTTRYDAVIEADGTPCGIIGLLSIDKIKKDAEYYITMGEQIFKGKGIATQASILILEYAFSALGLSNVYLFTETENVIAQRLFEKVGFVKQKRLVNDAISHGKLVDRFLYKINCTDYYKRNAYESCDNSDSILGGKI